MQPVLDEAKMERRYTHCIDLLSGSLYNLHEAVYTDEKMFVVARKAGKVYLLDPADQRQWIADDHQPLRIHMWGMH